MAQAINNTNLAARWGCVRSVSNQPSNNLAYRRENNNFECVLQSDWSVIIISITVSRSLCGGLDKPGVTNSSCSIEHYHYLPPFGTLKYQVKKKSPTDLSDRREKKEKKKRTVMNSTMLNYAWAKENTGWYLVMDGPYWLSSGSVCQKMGQGLQTNTNKCYRFRDCGRPALQDENSNRFWFNTQHRGPGPARDTCGVMQHQHPQPWSRRDNQTGLHTVLKLVYGPYPSHYSTLCEHVHMSRLYSSPFRWWLGLW